MRWERARRWGGGGVGGKSGESYLLYLYLTCYVNAFAVKMLCNRWLIMCCRCVICIHNSFCWLISYI